MLRRFLKVRLSLRGHLDHSDRLLHLDPPFHLVRLLLTALPLLTDRLFQRDHLDRLALLLRRVPGHHLHRVFQSGHLDHLALSPHLVRLLLTDLRHLKVQRLHLALLHLRGHLDHSALLLR
jgi:hypothetical protein